MFTMFVTFAPSDQSRIKSIFCFRQGYLFVQAKKNLKLGSVWTKYFCQYQSKTKTLTMIPYSQLSGKISGGESVRVTSCVCHDNSSDKFRFSVTGEDLTDTGAGMMTHNIQVRNTQKSSLGSIFPKAPAVSSVSGRLKHLQAMFTGLMLDIFAGTE